MGLLFWPILWILFMIGLWAAFATVAIRENKARAKAAKELLASQQAMAAAGAEMAPPEGEAGFDEGFGDGFGDASQPEFADFDENAFK
ncbi:MAG: hypothetical protein ACTHOU_11660 [Aureliella sp.]|jgi:hypothetical protein